RLRLAPVLTTRGWTDTGILSVHATIGTPVTGPARHMPAAIGRPLATTVTAIIPVTGGAVGSGTTMITTTGSTAKGTARATDTIISPPRAHGFIHHPLASLGDGIRSLDALALAGEFLHGESAAGEALSLWRVPWKELIQDLGRFAKRGHDDGIDPGD